MCKTAIGPYQWISFFHLMIGDLLSIKIEILLNLKPMFKNKWLLMHIRKHRGIGLYSFSLEILIHNEVKM